jgi:uncharacterized protein (DUF1778 family)
MKSMALKSKVAPAKPGYERLEARLSADLKRLFQLAADMRGVTLSDFVINSAHDVAVQTVEQHNVIHLNREASVQFAAALQRPARSIPRLRAAIIRHHGAAEAR